jgi:hypothetical protein
VSVLSYNVNMRSLQRLSLRISDHLKFVFLKLLLRIFDSTTISKKFVNF